MQRTWAPEEWARVRARGRAAFLLRHGVLARLPIAVAAAVAIEALFGGALPAALATPLFLLRLLGCVAVFSVGGCLRAELTWKLNERRAAGGV